jgi:transcriptional activator
VELAADAALRLGEPADLDALTALLDVDPLRESAAALLARCLHATGRQVEALAVLDRIGERLVSGVRQRGALQAAADNAIARADGDRPVAARLLVEAVAHAVGSKDGPVTAAVAELAAAHALAEGDPLAAAALLGVAAAHRGSCDLGDPEMRATLEAVRTVPRAAAALDRARALSRADGVALLQDYVRGLGAGPTSATGSALGSASATSRA